MINKIVENYQILGLILNIDIKMPPEKYILARSSRSFKKEKLYIVQ